MYKLPGQYYSVCITFFPVNVHHCHAETPSVQSIDVAAIIGGALGAIAVLVISGIVLLIIFLLWCNRRTALTEKL